jgi:hypothetical protein
MKARVGTAFVVVVAMIAAACGGNTSEEKSTLNGITMDDVTQRLKAGGFTVCATHEGSRSFYGVYASPEWDVMLNSAPCPVPDTSVRHDDPTLYYRDIVDGVVKGEAFKSARLRDARISQHRRAGRDYGGLLGYSYGPFLLGVTSTAKLNFIDGITKFLNTLPEAKPAWDNR